MHTEVKPATVAIHYSEFTRKQNRLPLQLLPLGGGIRNCFLQNSVSPGLSPHRAPLEEFYLRLIAEVDPAVGPKLRLSEAVSQAWEEQNSWCEAAPGSRLSGVSHLGRANGIGCSYLASEPKTTLDSKSFNFL